MFLENINGTHLLMLGLANCRITSVERALGQIRSSFPTVQTQLMRADRICGKEHLIFAARNAARAYTQPYKRSNSQAVELLLYASCQRQISKAIQILGVTPRTSEVVAVGLSEGEIPPRFSKAVMQLLKGSPDDAVFENLSEKKVTELMNTYGVTKIELAAARLPAEDRDSVLKRLIIERSVLLAIED